MEWVVRGRGKTRYFKSKHQKGGDYFMNLKQKEFALAYLKEKNATRAYTAVYGASSDKNASSAAARLLRRSDVRAFLAEQEAVITAAVQADVQYSRRDSFQYLCRVQEHAFDVTPKPDFTAILKAEELKGKLIGLYDKDRGDDVPAATAVEVVIRS